MYCPPDTESMWELEKAISSIPFCGVGLGPVICAHTYLFTRVDPGNNIALTLRTLIGILWRIVSLPFIRGSDIPNIPVKDGRKRVVVTWLFERPDLQRMLRNTIAGMPEFEILVLSRTREPPKKLANDPIIIELDPLSSMRLSRGAYTALIENLVAWYKSLKKFQLEYGLPWLFTLKAIRALLEGSLRFLEIERLIKNAGASALVTEHDRSEASVPIVLGAKAVGIPTLTLQHGMTVTAFTFIPPVADIFLAWGKLTAKMLLDAGIKSGRIAIVGNPALGVASQDCVQMPQAVNEEGVRSNRVVIATNHGPPEDERRIFVHTIVESLQDIDGLEIWVRPHPSENMSFYEDTLRAFRNIHYEKATREPEVVRAGSQEITICHESAYGLDAMSHGSIVIVADILTTPLKDVRWWLTEGDLCSVKSGSKLHMTIVKILTDCEFASDLRQRQARFLNMVHCAVGLAAGKNLAHVVAEAIDSYPRIAAI